MSAIVARSRLRDFLVGAVGTDGLSGTTYIAVLRLADAYAVATLDEAALIVDKDEMGRFRAALEGLGR